jgi:hypothetical protein
MTSMTSRLALSGSSLVFAIAVGVANACGVAHAQQHQVRYEVYEAIPGMADYINYRTDSGPKYLNNVHLPWSTEITAVNPPPQGYLVEAKATNVTIFCKLLLDGNVVSSASDGKPGFMGIVDCSH